jgi:uncharacterized SAM-binding protein YcdF (DUF218 family)
MPLETPDKTAARDSGRSVSGIILLLLAIAYVGGFLVFVTTLPVTQPAAVHADGIVALTGGTERLDAATALFETGVGKRLLISGVHATTTKAALKTLVHGGKRFACCADLGFQATNTHGNAEEAAQWARDHGYKTLIVVTASYHMPRSLTEFSAQMPHEKLIPYPVESDNLDVHAWWHNPVAFSVLQWEYAKYLGAVARASIFPPHPAQTSHDRHSNSV